MNLGSRKGLLHLADPQLEEHEPTPQELMLAEIMQRLDEVGDLPIFNASVNRVQVVGSDPDSDAVALATEVLKDANLTTKILKLANSTYYNRGRSVGALSRAIVVLGFDLLKSTVLTMKLIDSFNEQRPDTEIERMLVKAYMSAGFVKEMAEVVGLKGAEQSYICGLLHNMGDVIVASVMIDEYEEMEELVDRGECTWSEAQKKVLGMSMRKIGQAVVEKWEFPVAVTKTMMPPKTKAKGKIKDPVELNRSLSSLTNSMMDLIYSDNPSTSQNFTDLTKEMVKITGVNKDMVAASFDKAFKQSCDLAENYGLNKQHLMPNLRANSESGDKVQDEIIKSLTLHIQSKLVVTDQDNGVDESDGYDGYDDEPIEVSEVSESDPSPRKKVGLADTNAMLSIIQQITAFIGQKAPLNTVFGKVLEGMTRGVGFDRAMLCLLTPDRKSYASRIAEGKKSDIIRELFRNRELDVSRDLFSKVIMDGSEILIADIDDPEWSALLSTHDKEVLSVSSLMIASIQVQGKPVGLFYGDKIVQKSEITSEEYRGFLQLVAQAQLALQIR